MSKRRLDVTVADLAGVSREKAQALILEGRVSVDGRPALKAGAVFAADARIEVAGEPRFVGRGGEKLDKALEEFGYDVSGLRCLDVGASTGGFTDCLLQRGAASVVAVDVGYGQLAWKLRQDPRVRAVDRTNFRHATIEQLGAPFAFGCIDASFISLSKLAAKLHEMLSPGARLVALVKPQFEAGRASVGKGGVVRSDAAHVAAIESVCDAFARAGLEPQHLTFSPITGPAGNIEFLLGAVARGSGGARRAALDIAGVVRAAHETLAT
jgi:23S rRNA (cytidine1920-2'-O)/16S rRNA (cytidine1409-2'-O)-methyltransferase